MSVDFLECKHCGSIFADCEDFIICENCFEVWCCESCAEADRHVHDKCSLGHEISDCSPEDEDECNKEWCSDCDNFVIGTCGYCREEKFTDEELLEFAIKKLGLETKEQELLMLKSIGCSRFAYNWALGKCNERYKNSEIRIKKENEIIIQKLRDVLGELQFLNGNCPREVGLKR